MISYRKIWILALILVINNHIFPQSNSKKVEVGSFETTIIFNDEPSNVAYYVPLDYNENNSYKLIVGLHFCISPTVAYKTYRNLLIDLSDSLNAIIMCPDCHNNTSYPYQIMDSSIIYKSIDSTIEIYNIDTDYIYLTGGSCNGRSVLDYGLENIYDVRGVIAFNPYVPSLPIGYHNYDTEVPACTCSGTLDPSYTNASRLHDSLAAHGANEKLISMEGIGHDFWIPEFNIEMMNCIHWIDSINSTINVSESLDNNQSLSIKVFPNPFKGSTKIEITNKEMITDAQLELIDLYGLTIKTFSFPHQPKNHNTFYISNLAKRTYILRFTTPNKIICKKLISF